MTSTLKGVYQSLCIFLSEQQIQTLLGFHGIQVRSLFLGFLCYRISNILTQIFDKDLKITHLHLEFIIKVRKCKTIFLPLSTLMRTCYKNLKKC